MDPTLDRELKGIKKFKRKVGIALVVISIGCSVGIWQGQRAIDNSNADTAARIDESCTQREREWESKVESIQITYKYVDSLTEEQLKDPLTQLIIDQWPKTYKDITFARPISDCAKPGVGLEQPIKPLPAYRSLRNLQR